MLYNITENESQISRPHSTYQIEGNISYLQPEILALTSKIKTATSSSEPLIHQTNISFTDEEPKPSCCQARWFKYLIAGITLLAGTGALVSGSLNYYSRREMAEAQAGELLHAGFMQKISAPYINEQIHDAIALPTNHTLPPDNTTSPYSYYQEVYDTKAVTSVTASNDNSDIIMSRQDFLDSIPKDSYYPLGKKIYFVMGEFYMTEIDYFIASALNGSENNKHSAVKNLLETFDAYKASEARIIDRHQNKEKLLASEHIEEILAHRMTVSLLIAADVIINNKSKFHYMTERTLDNTQYSNQQIAEMESNIRKYIIEEPKKDDSFKV